MNTVAVTHGGDSTSSRVSNEGGSLDLESIQHVDGLASPQSQAVPPGMIAIAQTHPVVIEGNDAMTSSELLAQALLPVGNAAPRPMQEQEHVAGSDVQDMDPPRTRLQERGLRVRGRLRSSHGLEA
jgi:hypothetical protein